MLRVDGCHEKSFETDDPIQLVGNKIGENFVRRLQINWMTAVIDRIHHEAQETVNEYHN